MLSNVYFWRNTGYFGGAAETKPLLHTWSLAVEEQFYLVYPFLLLVCRRLSRARLLTLLCIITAASLALSEWAAHAAASASFFMLPTRAWEMLLGATLVLCPPPTRLRPWISNALSWLGMAAICGAALSFDSTTTFPGFAALPPCLGAALLIYSSATRRTLLGDILASRPLVLIGLMSYSLYLWHWPVLSFLRYWGGDQLPLAVRVGALVVSFALAYASWRYVEAPFRRGFTTVSGGKVALAAVALTFCLVTISLGIDQTRGLPGRLPKRVVAFCHVEHAGENLQVKASQIRQEQLPRLGVVGDGHRFDFLLWGDSHALALGGLCDTLAQEHGLSGVIAARLGTAPLVGIWRPTQGKDAIDWNDAVLDFVRKHRVSHVLLVSRWAVYVDGRPGGGMDTLVVDEHSRETSPTEARTAFSRALRKTIALLEAHGAAVWVLKQVPLQEGTPNRKLVWAALAGRDLPVGVSLAEHFGRQASVNDVINTATTRSTRILDPAEYCFDNHGCSRLGSASGTFYTDDNHLSSRGADRLLGPMLEPVFARFQLQQTKAAGLPQNGGRYDR